MRWLDATTKDALFVYLGMLAVLGERQYMWAHQRVERGIPDAHVRDWWYVTIMDLLKARHSLREERIE